jgi:glycine/D-amino acid oxidase-like deaminating enzyme
VEVTPVWDSTVGDDELSVLAPGVPDGLDRTPDVAVVGAGVLGLAIAAMCVRAGAESVVVLERGRLAGGASGRNAGVLAPEPHVWTDPPALVELGRRSLRLTRVLDAEWDGALGLQELDCLLVGAGADAPMPWEAPVEVLDEAAVRDRVPAVSGVSAALLIAGQARVHPLRFAAGLAGQAGTVATGADVIGHKIRHNNVLALTTTIGEFHPGVVVFATGVAPRTEVAVAHHFVKGHLATTEPVSFRLGCQVVTPLGGALQLADGRLLTGGTLDEGDDSPGVRPDVVQELRRGLDRVIPMAAAVPFSHAWCGFRPATPDRLPIIDRVPTLDNAWFTSGHYRTGVLMAVATGEALAHWIIIGERPPHAAPFALSRFR